MNYKIYLIKSFIYKFLNQKEKLLNLNLSYYRSRGVKIGTNVRTSSPLLSAEPYLLEFGNNITVSTNVSFVTHDNSVTKVIPNSTDTFGKIKIGNNCFIGNGSIILPGVELGDNVIVGAGSVVTKSYKQGNVVIAGNPSKVICTTDQYSKKAEPFALNTLGLTYQQKKEKLLLIPSNKLLNK